MIDGYRSTVPSGERMISCCPMPGLLVPRRMSLIRCNSAATVLMAILSFGSSAEQASPILIAFIGPARKQS